MSVLIAMRSNNIKANCHAFWIHD